ncbi:esterase family protein [Spirosoma sp. BT702]|uniref:Esterase family protein n=1 Tax=Spirosoma profusum TaxID=2771354 RepID=A0A926Y2Q4_9BACT|nr:alpha/beta hydrolase-fold protein [Spirosoma profusum]MBD2703307.1 esterase family protein [Spirosoma profusum]
MKPFLLCLFVFISGGNLSAQNSIKGKVIIEKFVAPSLQGNHAGEDPMRRLTIYLPPGYEASKQRYPVIYFLHGGMEMGGDSIVMAWWRFHELMDAAIQNGRIKPMILVLPNSDAKLGSGFYTNSTLTGNWADYIAKDVVAYIDKRYRTIAGRHSRGLSGQSMGGHGALKIGMLYPDVFTAVYALSPGNLGWGGDFSLEMSAFKHMDSYRNQYSEAEIMGDLIKRNDFTKFYTKAMANLARAYSPDEAGKTFLSAKMPVSYSGDRMMVDEETKRKWEANFPINMIESHLAGLKSLTALKLDWGRNEEIKNVPIASLQFSKKLEANQVKHFAEEYIGGHVSHIGGFEGRIYTEMLPFFDTYLTVESKE